MSDDEEEYETEVTLFVIPGTMKIGKWRDLIDYAQGGSTDELVGLRAGPNGELLGVFRKKAKS